jgi:hypothetical protein
MDIKQTNMNCKFVYSHDGVRIKGIEYDINIEVKLDLPSDSPVKWQYVEFLNETYEQAKRRIKSVSFSE